jgi:phospholipase C
MAKSTITTFTRCIQLLLLLGAAIPCAGRPGKIEHFVVLMMENRPFDHMFGCLAGEGRLKG